MKNIIIVIALLLHNLNAGNAPSHSQKSSDFDALLTDCEEIPNPVYLDLFLSKIGIVNYKKYSKNHASLESFIETMGGEKVMALAKKAIDLETRGPYFSILESKERFIIKKTYPMMNCYRMLMITFYRNNGVVTRISFSEADFYSQSNPGEWSDGIFGESHSQGTGENEK
jgi:hypothetical protein